jgi:uncharacterized oligopeptide transporter (OPT) family protein
MNQLKGLLAEGQLTARSILVGSIGCVIITASSVYTALKMGALPWPIVLAAVVSLFALRGLNHGRASLNEANVTHTIMSAGAMVAGGLAFTIPGIWILGNGSTVEWWQMLLVAFSGVVLGLIFTAVLHHRFIDGGNLEFPMGEAAATTLVAGNGDDPALAFSGSAPDMGAAGEQKKGTGRVLFGSMGFAGIYTILRDALGVLPTMLFSNVAVPGVAFGIYNSPMMVAVGFLVGTTAMIVWFGGALLGNFGIVVGGSAWGLWDIAAGQGIKESLGMGLMMGSGIAVILKEAVMAAIHRRQRNTDAAGAKAEPSPAGGYPRLALPKGMIAIGLAAVALVLCFALNLGMVASLIVVAFALVTCAMSAQSVGQSGIDPMEVFGLIVLLIVAACANVPQVQLFFTAAVIAVACGLTGDMMNDFQAGHMLKTSPQAQWAGQAIGGLLGAFVAVGVMVALVSAYGTGAFGPTGMFVSAQATVVATMVSGIPSVPAFAIGLVAGFALYLAGFPAMMLGLGVYLPFYLSASAFLGALAKMIADAVCKMRAKKLPEGKREAAIAKMDLNGMLVSSGLLGGESIVGVVLALITAAAALSM